MSGGKASNVYCKSSRVLDTHFKEWNLQSMHSSRFQHSLAGNHLNLFATGGCNESYSLNKVERYSFHQMAWSNYPLTNEKRYKHSSSLVHDNMFCFFEVKTMTIEKLKNMAVKWEYVNIKPNQREYNQPVFAAYLKDEILVFNQDPNK